MVTNPDTRQALRLAAIAETLRQCALFSDLPAADLEAVAEACVLRRLDRREFLFREGERAEGFYVVRSGAVSVHRVTPDGREHIICVFHPHEAFAEATLATFETYPASAAALEPSQVVMVRKPHFRALVERKPELALRMLASMSIHLKHLVQTMQDLKGTQVEKRLAEWLLRRSSNIGTGCPEPIELGVSKKVLAGQLGVTSETLSRTFARLRKEGVIRVVGPRVDVLDPDALGTYAKGKT